LKSITALTSQMLPQSTPIIRKEKFKKNEIVG